MGDDQRIASLPHIDERSAFMTDSLACKQFSFRLPQQLVDEVEGCAKHIRAQGLEVTRADVVRLLLNHALDTTRCRLDLLLRPLKRRSIARRRG
jgi:hypothetical protein